MKNTKILTSPKALIACILTGLFAIGLIITPFVRADQFQAQIDAINQENANNRQSLNRLGAEAASLSEVISKLQGEINVLQNQITANQTKRDETVKQIAIAEAELAKQKKLLGENIKAMYLEGQISTLEMLASSKDLSEFVDKEQYRNTVKNKIKTTLDRINELKAQLKAQKESLEKLIADQQAMQGQLASQQAEQNRLLNLNESQRAELDGQIKNNNGRIAELRRQQAAANARLLGNSSLINGGACSPRPQNSYPDRWCAIAQDSTIDSWGMYNRECVSYTAWKVAESNRHMPYWGGVGNANQWDDNAIAAGIPVDSNPRVGDVAVSNAGYYGHVMYVEHVYDDGTIYISQYNFNLNGTYSEARINPGGLVFIHF